MDHRRGGQEGAPRRARPGDRPPRSPLHACPHLDESASPGEAGPALASVTDQPTLVVVDDADAVEDTDGAIAGLLAKRLPDAHVVASGRPDVLRSLYGHWTQTVRRSKLGVLLNPNLDFDGDLLSSPLPRRQRVAPNPGRGYLVNNGEVQLVQLAQPARPRRSATRRRRSG